ncbi:MAG: CocE/NonD family hydrolase [Gammaproteobacteria bacterium]
MLASPKASVTGATIRRAFPHRVREVRHAWIPLADGTRLATRYWLPEDAEQHPVPAILEYIPYCKRDGTAGRDEAMHPYFAGHGYAALRVDIRGTGESEGVLLDEYLALEQDDALEVIAWIAAQPWCTGRVGMMGKSWGGFNALQVAARRPPALGCILTVCSTVDRYADDIHYMGGCLLTNNPGWGFVMFGALARAPDPRLAGDQWRDLWRGRLDAVRPWVIDWLRHQRRDDYWKHGSVCEDFAAIECPVYAVGGWADGYSNAVPRLLEGLRVPCKGLVGPWGHQYPHQARPEPMVGFLQEAVRWWDHWLKGVDSGVMDEPRLQVWMQDSVAPRTAYRERPGRWVAEQSWPSPGIVPLTYWITGPGIGEGLSRGSGTEGIAEITCPVITGIASPAWSDHGEGGPEAPDDQRPDDARSIVFDSAPLDEALEILGSVRLDIGVAIDRPIGFLCVRLCDVAPGGASTRVTWGLMNLTHCEDHERVAPVSPGTRIDVKVTLNDVAHRFLPGHRIRLAVATACWPVVWPSPEPTALTVYTGTGSLTLPRRTVPNDEQAPPRLPPAEMSAPDPVTVLRSPTPTEAYTRHDLVTGRTTVTERVDAGRMRIERDGWEFGQRGAVRRSIVDGDPLSARIELEGELEFGRADELDVRIETSTTMTATRDAFQVQAHIDVSENGKPLFSRSWLETIPRDGI